MLSSCSHNLLLSFSIKEKAPKESRESLDAGLVSMELQRNTEKNEEPPFSKLMIMLSQCYRKVKGFWPTVPNRPFQFTVSLNFRTSYQV